MKSAVLLLTVLYLSGCVNNPIDSNLENWEIHTASIENTQLRISIPPQPRVSKAASNYSSYDALDDQEVILFVGYDSPGLNPYVAPQFGVMVRAERDQSQGQC